jgi:hypothetical protein
VDDPEPQSLHKILYFALHFGPSRTYTKLRRRLLAMPNDGIRQISLGGQEQFRELRVQAKVTVCPRRTVTGTCS